MRVLQKMFRLSDIRYPWLLLVSLLAFVAALCFHRFDPDAFTPVELAVYGAVFVVALLWSLLNYMGHLKISAIYRKHDSIEAFIRGLSMGKEEKAELSQYLHDFIRDLEEGGAAHDEAVQTAIGHFQVKEFTASAGMPFETPAHFYLLGYGSIFVGIALVLQCVSLVASLPFFLSAVRFGLLLFGVALGCLFFVYKLIDGMIAKK